MLATACASDPPSALDGGTSPRDAAPTPDSGAAAPDSGAPPPDAGTTADAGTPPTTPCPDGSPMAHYAFTALTAAPALAAIDLPNLHPNTIIAVAHSEDAHLVRLDVCPGRTGAPTLHALMAIEYAFEAPRLYLTDDTLTAQREEFITTPLGQVFEVRLPPSDLVVEGLAAALAGDLTQFRVRILGMNGMLLVGHAGFVAAARGNVSASAIDYTSLTVVVGGLGPGDPFGGRPCPFGHTPLEETFRLGTATFAVGGCSFLGGGATTGYEFHRLSVEDSNPLLMPADRARLTFATKAEVDAVLTYRWNHHNACDSFHLALPHADYAASSAPMAGCGMQVPNAPPRQFEEPFDAPVKYRFRYYGGAGTDAEAVGCSSYMSCD